MSQAARELTDLRRARRLVLQKRRVKADGSLCYRCLRPREFLYPMQLPGYMFPYEEPDTGMATDIRICADCLRDVCERLAKWVLNP